ncbi:MAG: PepSY domain-containing protein [Deltaproteobacteria bacterium]|nr:PepSY domain-containing protein [Deltaproteobacteria bacterium]
MKKKFRQRLFPALHKYTGLLALAFCVWMAVSGVLLNHPQILKPYSLPNQLMPANYQYVNWNRMSWRDAVFSGIDDNLLYVGGKEGVWRSLDQGKTFSPLRRGFPRTPYEQDTFSLLLARHAGQETLYAGTRAGLFRWQQNSWQALGDRFFAGRSVVDVIQVEDRVLAFTDSAAYQARLDEEPPVFRPLPLPRKEKRPPRVPLFRWLLKLHDGSLWGLPGRLGVDIIGLALLFLSLSGLLVWYVKWRRKARKATRLSGRFFAFNYRWHLKLGIAMALLIAVTTLSGMLVRPPLLIAIVNFSVPAAWMPELDPENPWAGRIQRATWMPGKKKLVLATRQGLFAGPADGSAAFIHIPDAVPIHAMGATVFKTLDNDSLLIGSFSGLYLWNTREGIVIQLRSRSKLGVPDWGRPLLVTGVAIFDNKPLLVADYDEGLKSLRQDNWLRPEMPAAISSQSRISLWNALFELHNGRIFEEYLGPLYWFIIPTGGLALLTILATGILGWMSRRRKREPRT